MYGPISPVGGDLAPMFQLIFGSSQTPAAGLNAGSGVGAGTGAQAVNQALQTGIQGLLQTTGGTSQNDKILQTLMALLLLIVMLASSEQNKSAAGGALSDLARDFATGSPQSSTLSSETSIFWESTTVSYTSDPQAHATVLTDSTATPTQGSQLDVSA